jgi:Ferredoxin-like domain in Api92-like protein
MSVGYARICPITTNKGNIMPNWVYNGLTIEGPAESVNKLVNQVNQPFVDHVSALGDLEFNLEEVKYSNPVFSFRNIIAPTDLEAYKEQPREYANGEVVKENPDSWYNWNIRNWGVKWDVAVSDNNSLPSTYMEGPTENGDNLVVYYNFETPWGVADEALLKLSSQYPDLLFTLSFEEETGWGGEWELLSGKIISQSEYDNKCNECDEYNTLEYCEDCENEICSTCGYGTSEEGCSIHPVEANV